MWVVAALTLGMPWVVLRGIEEPFLAPKLFVWMAGCLVLCGVVWFGLRPNGSIPCRPLQWLSAWVLLSGLCRFYIPYLFRKVGHSVTVSGDAWLSTVYVLLGLASIASLQAFLAHASSIERITQWCCWTAAAMAVYQGVQWMGWDVLYAQDMRRVATETHYAFAPYAGLGNIQYAAMTQAITAPLWLLFKHRGYLVGLGVVVAAVLLSHVRLAVVALGVSLGAYGVARAWALWPKGRQWLAGAVLVSLLGGVVVGGPLLRRDERWIVWGETLYQWQRQDAAGRSHALLGWGLQSFPAMFWSSTRVLRPETVRTLGMERTRWDSVHNDVLQAVLEWGAVGALLLLWAVGSLLWQGWRRATQPVPAGWWASGVSLLWCSVVSHPWHIAWMVWLGSLIVAMNLRQPERVMG